MSIEERRRRKASKPTLRQRIIMAIFVFAARIYVWFKYGFGIKSIKVDQPFILMSNHGTDLDIAMVYLAVKGYKYIVYGEHLDRDNKFAARFMRILSGIPVYKGSISADSTLKILRKIRDGNNICIFPEGSRTSNGLTNPITESTAKLVKHAKCALVTFRLDGAYFVQPRWAKTWRRGKIKGSIQGVYSSEEIADMTEEQVFDLICRDLHEDSYVSLAREPRKYKGKALAEGLENILYLCPKCLKYDTLSSSGNQFFCSCGLRGEYNEYAKLIGDGLEFDNVTDWDRWQSNQLDSLFDSDASLEFSVPDTSLTLIHPDKREELLLSGKLNITREGLFIGDYSFPFAQTEGMGYISQGNILLFAFGTLYYQLSAARLGSEKIRRLYVLKKSSESILNGKYFDPAK